MRHPLSVITWGLSWFKNNRSRRALLGSTVGVIGLLGFETVPPFVSPVAAQAVTPTPKDSNSVSIDPSMFGANVSGWDPWMLTPSGVNAIQTMGFGYQQFPNCPWIYNWSTNESLNNGQWYPIPVSLSQWATELEQSHNKGLYIVPYGFNRAGTSGATVGTVQRLTEAIVHNHYPIDALVIGSEQYGSWAQNLHSQQTPERYGQLAAQMAQAIHKIDPSMKVGVDFNLPASPAQPTPQDIAWNQTVLSLTAPYIQFVSVHIYPLSQVQGNVSLLQSVYTQLATDMTYVHSQIAQYAGSYAPTIQPWVTEFNPYGLESQQSVQPVFGSALVQSYLQMMSLGAGQVDWWAMYGDAHAPQPLGSLATNTPLATGNNVPFASNGLASEGIAPQPTPENKLYDTGTAYETMMHLVGSSAILRVLSSLYNTYHVFAADIHHANGNNWVLINDSHKTVTINLAGQSVSLSPTAMKVWQGIAPFQSPSVVNATTHSTPSITQATWDPNTNQLSIWGQQLGTLPPTIPAHGKGIDQAKLMVSDLTTNANYGWSYPSVNTDWYGITPVTWTPNKIVLQLDGPTPQTGNILQLSWWKSIGYMDLESFQMPVTWKNGSKPIPVSTPPSANSGGTINNAHYNSQTQTVTINGESLGAAPSLTKAGGGGYDQSALKILIQGSNIEYGFAAPGINTDWYGVIIDQWTPKQIVLRLSTPPSPNPIIQVNWTASDQTVIANILGN